MIRSKTYLGTSGLNYVQAPELAFAIIYVVKREGLQYDKYVSGSANRTHVHESSSGKIYFPNVFSSGNPERVFVLFKTGTGTEPETPPGVCVPVSISAITLPPAVLGSPYIASIPLSGTAPFVITPGTVPGWGVLTNSGNAVTLSGTPDVGGAQVLSFDAGNCSGSTAPFSGTIYVVNDTPNMSISNGVSGTKIISVSGVTYSNLNQPFPIAAGETMTASYTDFTGVVSINIAVVVFPFILEIKKNGVSLQTMTIFTDGVYDFASQSFLSTDLLEISTHL